mmetsp:Transcript_5381/g.13008  ORF Transcript_5381/g.13008 Transcript_5381/m.13008 type:complete len:317 (+) Transcript_5381:126-1076(+)
MPANAPVAGTRSFSAVRFVREDNSEYQTPVYFVPSDTADGDGSPAAPVLMQAQRSQVRDWMRGENGNGPSPALKRVRSPMLQRDSLKSRYSPGRPGSRRHRRWMNDNLLREELDEDELKELYALDYHSALSDLFYGDNMQKWDEFCALDEDAQRQLLKGRESAKPAKPQPKPTDDPRLLFERLDRKVKAMLRRGAGTDFLAAFEARLCTMLHGHEPSERTVEDEGFELVPDRTPQEFDFELVRTVKGAEVELEDPMQRLVVHAVCSFHSLSSQSHINARTGRKQLVIGWPKGAELALRPRTSLCEFLRSEEEDESC